MKPEDKKRSKFTERIRDISKRPDLFLLTILVVHMQWAIFAKDSFSGGFEWFLWSLLFFLLLLNLLRFRSPNLLRGSDDPWSYDEYQDYRYRQDEIVNAHNFLAGVAAFKAFRVAWEESSSQQRASVAYFMAKINGLNSWKMRRKAFSLDRRLRWHPRFRDLIDNRFGRCEDEFERAFRNDGNEKLKRAAERYVLCKCQIIEAIREIQIDLESDLQEFWDDHQCELLLEQY